MLVTTKSYNWIKLSDEEIQECRKIAKERDDQKKDFATARYWNRDSIFVGLVAEKIIEKITGRKIDRQLKVMGDGGKDFEINGKKVDIKASKYWKDVHLLMTVDDPLRADYYVLVGLDLDDNKGFVAGWATREEIMNAELKPLGYGKALRRAIHWSELRDGLPFS